MMIKSKLRARERQQDTARLRAPQCLPLLGDGFNAQAVLSPRRGGPDSYLGRNKRGHWGSIPITTTRPALALARYRDWLAARDERREAA